MRSTRPCCTLVCLALASACTPPPATPQDRGLDLAREARAEDARASDRIAGATDRAHDGARSDAPAVVPSGEIVAALSLNQSSGIAPLAVHLDATATSWKGHTALEVLRELTFEWDFGDQGGTWAHGVAKGSTSSDCCAPLAGHVYATPGSYTVKLTVRRGLKDLATATKPVTVHDVADPVQGIPASAWLCVSQGADFTGCPQGATTRSVTPGSLYAEMTKALGQGFRRLLFRRGETWAVGHAVNVSGAKGPVRVEPFGSGARPKFVVTNAQDNWAMFESTGATVKVSFLELAVDGGGDSHKVSAFHLGSSTLVRGCSILASYSSVLVQNQKDVVIAENEIVGTSAHGGGPYLDGERVLVLGNRIHDTTKGEHVVRAQNAPRLVVAHNTLTKPLPGRHALTIRGVTDGYAVVDNVLAGAEGWALQVGPQDANNPGQLVEHGVIERNLIAGDDVALKVEGPRLVVRNTMLLTSNSTCISVGQKCAACPRPDDVDLLNLSCFNATTRADVDVHLLAIGSSSRSRLVNSLLVAPGSSRLVLLAGAAAASHNLATSKSPFAGSPSVLQPEAADLKLAASASQAIDQGELLDEVLYDLFGAARLVPDLGAHER